MSTNIFPSMVTVTIINSCDEYPRSYLFVGAGGNLELRNGTLSHNSHDAVTLYAGNFTMTGGTISGNNNSGVVVQTNGGSVVNGCFIMEGGTIRGNTSTRAGGGGGVHVRQNANFSKTGGIIYGNDAKNPSNNNTARYFGHAVLFVTAEYYVDDSFIVEYVYRNSTLFETDNLCTNVPLPVNPGETLNGWTRR